MQGCAAIQQQWNDVSFRSIRSVGILFWPHNHVKVACDSQEHWGDFGHREVRMRGNCQNPQRNSMISLWHRWEGKDKAPYEYLNCNFLHFLQLTFFFAHRGDTLGRQWCQNKSVWLKAEPRSNSKISRKHIRRVHRIRPWCTRWTLTNEIKKKLSFGFSSLHQNSFRGNKFVSDNWFWMLCSHYWSMENIMYNCLLCLFFISARLSYTDA